MGGGGDGNFRAVRSEFTGTAPFGAGVIHTGRVTRVASLRKSKGCLTKVASHVAV